LARRCTLYLKRLFAGARFLGFMLSEMPSIVALWRVAPSVRFRDFAILASGSLRAMPLRRRRSSFDHGRLTDAFLRRTTALSTLAPTRQLNSTTGVMHGFPPLATFASQSRAISTYGLGRLDDFRRANFVDVAIRVRWLARLVESRAPWARPADGRSSSTRGLSPLPEPALPSRPPVTISRARGGRPRCSLRPRRHSRAYRIGRGGIAASPAVQTHAVISLSLVSSASAAR
jgi:hypothetical protein